MKRSGERWMHDSPQEILALATNTPNVTNKMAAGTEYGTGTQASHELSEGR